MNTTKKLAEALHETLILLDPFETAAKVVRAKASVALAALEAERAAHAEPEADAPAPAPAVQVVVDRERVWIKRGVQSFMLAYEGDKAECDWYAEQLRAALVGHQPGPAVQGEEP
jgi:hypothetical protein